MLLAATQSERRGISYSMNPGIPELEALIREEITKHGPMSFARFMELALYHPQWGYYTRPLSEDDRPRIGWTGDFYTSSDVHPVLGWALAKQLAEVDTALGHPAQFTVVEIGPGKGLLARDLLHSCAATFPAFLERLQYVLIDRSPRHRAVQREILAPWVERGRVAWQDSILGFEPNSLVGVVLSNELLDAFPVHRLSMIDGTLCEDYVDLLNGSLCSTPGPLSSPALAAYFDRLGITLSNDARAEVNLQALEWMHDVACRLKQGMVITIDYGHTAPDLYDQEHAEGTLRSYAKHRVAAAPFEAIGRQDLTSHVDFTSVAQAGERAGLSHTGFTNQLSFLMSMGVDSYCATLPEDSLELLAIAHLMRPHGMGTTFKLLMQQKGLPKRTWQGLTHRPFFESILETPSQDCR